MGFCFAGSFPASLLLCSLASLHSAKRVHVVASAATPPTAALLNRAARRSKLGATSSDAVTVGVIDSRRNVAVCQQLQVVLAEKQAAGISPLTVASGDFFSESGGLCELPSPWATVAPTAVASVVVIRVTTDPHMEQSWAALPPGGVLVVELGVGAEDAIWQALYQVHSELYYKSYLASLNLETNLGLPELQFATFLPGGAMVLQKASQLDLVATKGEFLSRAEAAGTDKIFGDHNYQLEYHRFLDTTSKSESGMMLEIGLGCTMDYGAGASAKIWPQMFPHLAVHFIEINKQCVDKWMPAMRADRVAKVHVGSQDDSRVLGEATADAASTPGGLQIVMDDGSHECRHIEASFRGLFPHLSHHGLYFVEDMMYSAWGTSGRQPIRTKTDRTFGTPIALAAILAADVTGALNQQVNRPPAVAHWADGVLSQLGGTVDLVECTPGVCTFRHK